MKKATNEAFSKRNGLAKYENKNHKKRNGKMGKTQKKCDKKAQKQ